MNSTDMITVGEESQRLARILAQLQNFKGVTLPKVEDGNPPLSDQSRQWAETTLPTGRNAYYALNQHGQYELSPLFVEKIVSALLSGGNMLVTMTRNEQSTASG